MTKKGTLHRRPMSSFLLPVRQIGGKARRPELRSDRSQRILASIPAAKVKAPNCLVPRSIPPDELTLLRARTATMEFVRNKESHKAKRGAWSVHQSSSLQYADGFATLLPGNNLPRNQQDRIVNLGHPLRHLSQHLGHSSQVP